MGPGQIIKNRINLDLIEIIQFCLKMYDLLTHPHLWVGTWVVGWMGGLICGSMETTWGQHEDNMETNMGSTWGPQGCGDHMWTMWRQHGDNVGTTGMWRPHGDNMETTWGPQGCGDQVGTTWRQHGDNMRTMWRQHGHNVGTTGMWRPCGDNMGSDHVNKN